MKKETKCTLNRIYGKSLNLWMASIKDLDCLKNMHGNNLASVSSNIRAFFLFFLFCGASSADDFGGSQARTRLVLFLNYGATGSI